MQSQQMEQGPPYRSKNAALGGLPTTNPDVPISAVFLVLFLIGAVCHMTILQVNLRRGHKFIISGMIFGFCMARSATMILRIVWSQRQTNIRLAIAANVFVAAGVILLFIVNILFTQRIVRAQHPHGGWHPALHWFFISLYVWILVTLAMLITTVIQQFYTLNDNTRRIDRDVQLYGQTVYTIISFLPIPFVLFGLAIPRKTRTEKFGEGRFRNKIYILLTSSVLLCAGAAFRTGTNFKTPRPVNDPAPYQNKACFYIFNFTVEIIVVYLYIIVRVDKRFWIPNGSHGQGDYLRAKNGYGSKEPKHDSGIEDNEEETEGKLSRRESMLDRAIAPEEEVFDDMTPDELAKQDAAKKVRKPEETSSNTV